MELEYNDIEHTIGFIPNKSSVPELFGRRVGYSNPKYPGFYHVHSIKDYSVVYMDEATCNEFDASLDDIVAIGAKFQAMVTHPDDLDRVRQLHVDLLEKGDETENLVFFQRILFKVEKKQGYHLVATSVRLNLTDGTFMCISNTTDQLPVFSIKICNALNTQFETKKHVKSYMTLTPREQEVFGYLSKGLTVKEIANEIVRSVRTVEQHKKNIYKKFGVNSLAQLVRITNFLGLA